MKRTVLVLLAFVTLIVAPVFSADSGSRSVAGQRATTTLLATARIAPKATPDGMRFLVLVARKADVTGQFSMKETRDFTIAGESYREKTKTEHGKEFEPLTVFDTAEGFIIKEPGMRNLVPADSKGAYILAIMIGGAKLTPGAKGEITLNVGFDNQTEPFTFQFAVPPDRAASPKP